MGFLDIIRQLQLLLWKNYVLRKRQKVRVFVEFLWPLALFLVLLIVRITTSLVTNQSACHYPERPLPSAGLVPFVRTLACELSYYTCYNQPVDSFYNDNLTELASGATRALEFLNDPEVVSSGSTVINYLGVVAQQRELATQVTQSFSLIEATNSGFQALLVSLSLDPLNSSTISWILNSNPNFNYLYSNYTQDYQEPFPLGSNPNLINFFYGSDLDRIDLLRDSNRVDNATWLREQMCNGNTNYLLRKANQSQIYNQQICVLDNTQLVSLFVLISTQLNYTRVKYDVYEQSLLSNSSFITGAVDAINSAIKLQSLFQIFLNESGNSSLVSALANFIDDIENEGAKKVICGNSNSSVFDLISNSTSNQTTKNAASVVSSFVTMRQLNIQASTDSQNCTYDNKTSIFDSAFNRSAITSQNCFCQRLLATVEQSAYIAQVTKPYLYGYILYAPNTTVYNEVIKRANQTFSTMSGAIQLFNMTASLIDSLILNDTVVSVLQQLAATPNPWNINTTDLNRTLSTLDKASVLLRFGYNLASCLRLDKFRGYATEQEMVKAGTDLGSKQLFWAGIVFNEPETVKNNQPSLPDLVSYKIRMNSSSTHDTNFAQDRIYRFQKPVYIGCSSCQDYFLFGFIYIQDMLEKAIIEVKTGGSQLFGLVSQMMPYPCFKEDAFISAVAYSLPLIMVLAWIYTVSMLIKDIVYEKEKRLKEFMRIMGLSNGIHWLSWFITSFSIMFLVSIILSFVLKYGDITSKSEISCLLVFLTCFIISTITLCFLISVFFNKANIAAAVGGITYFVLYLPYMILINYQDVITNGQQFVASLSSTVAFGYGCQLLANYEIQNVGINWKTFYETPFSQSSSFTMNSVCLIMLFDAFIYMVLAWYIEGIKPGEFGIPRPFYFPLQPSYWFGDSKKIKFDKLEAWYKNTAVGQYFEKRNSSRKLIESEEAKNTAESIKEAIQKIEEDEKSAGIKIERLHKIYPRGNNHALKGLSVNFYENEITSFLGHNGAGKSTTMHLLIGLYKPTAGTAFINGLDITESMDTIRKSLGFVPQHNVLFDRMTVKDHLWFYARLKGLDRKSTREESAKMLEDTGLGFKKDEPARSLSGGMQRKLSVAIAFVGGSKTVILDEPSAGVDPSGRRGIWDLLFKYREGRTVVISTHHLDEADVLGDRIAIISNGKLVAHGTSYFLKNKFGRGYNMTIAKKPESIREPVNQTGLDFGPMLKRNSSSDKIDSGAQSLYSESAIQSRMSLANDETDTIQDQKRLEESLLKQLSQDDLIIDKLIKSKLPSAILTQSLGSELTYCISNKAEDTRNYDKFFSQLEANMDNLGIESIGLSDSTLEEIFIRLAKQPEITSFKYKGKFNVRNMIDKSRQCWESFINCNWLNKNKEAKEPSAEELQQYSEYTKMRNSSGLNTTIQQWYALLIKRFHRVKRNIKGFFAEIVLPIVFVCLALLVATLNPMEGDRPSLELHPWYYDFPNKIFLSKSSSYAYDRPDYSSNPIQLNSNPQVQSNIDLVNSIYKNLITTTGLGTRCLSNHQITLTSQAQKRRDFKQLQCNSDYNLNKNYTSIPADVAQELQKANYSYTKTSLVCDCSTGFPECPVSASGDVYYRPEYTLKSQDIMFDLSGRNITDWIVKTEFSDSIFRKRFGGYEFLQTVFNDTDTAAQIDQLLNSTGLDSIKSLLTNQNIKIWFNNKGYLTSVAYLNVINNLILREMLSSSSTDIYKQGIVAYNHPMPLTQKDLLDDLDRQVYINLFVSICIIFGLSFIPASFLVFLVEERQNNSKQLQFVSGVKPYMYWVANFTWDLVNYLVPCVLCILVFLIFQIEAYICEENIGCLILLILLYGWACIPLMYPLEYLFKTPSTAFVASSCTNVFLGCVTTITVTTLDQLGTSDNNESLKQASATMKPIFYVLFPHFCLGQGLITMSLLYNQAQIFRSYGVPYKFNPFDFDQVGQALLAMAIQGLVYFIFNLLIQYKFFIPFKPKKDLSKLNLPSIENEDDDVHAERKRIIDKKTSDRATKKRFKFLTKKKDSERYQEEAENEINDKDYIRLVNLTKIYRKRKRLTYKRNVAVNQLCLGINKGECFGLIGVNGAGKTTTFKMITGEIPISAGDVYIGENSVSKQLEKAHRNIGYCPQSDAIFPLLTAREHLIFYARLRGIPEKHVKKVSEWALYRVGLQVFADRISGDFSGGNKRKLSTAIALVGDPSVICLDEPTSGMDAKARRLLWNDILSLIKENRIVILTSHSMEECEALCTRLVIMVNGQFKCIGSPQHLKTKFGSGYWLTVRLNHEEKKDELFKLIKDNFPESTVQETHKNLFIFVLPFSTTKLSQVFYVLEKHRNTDLAIIDYSISQTTLDQIFINFAQEQKEDPFNDEANKNPNVEDDVEMSEIGASKSSLGKRESVVTVSALAQDLEEKRSNNRKESIVTEYKSVDN